MIKTFLISLIPPYHLTLFLLSLALLFVLFKHRRLGISLACFALLWLTIWSMPISSLYLGGYLEHRYPQQNISLLKPADVIVVLGGHTAENRVNWFDETALETYSRIQLAAELYHQNKAPFIIVSGGTTEGTVSEASVMTKRLKQLNIPESAIFKEEHSTTTYENAKYTAELIQALNFKRILLVTSALHMPRAYDVFLKQDLDIIAVPTPAQITIPKSAPKGFAYIPNQRSLEASRSILKEYVGWLIYKFRNWI